MAGKQAKLLSARDVAYVLDALGHHRHHLRDKVMFLLSLKAGLRAGEIAALTWAMVCDAQGDVSATIELQDWAAKKGSGRTIPINPDLRIALEEWRACTPSASGAVVRSERNRPMTAATVTNWFAALYRSLGLSGCSSHSGRRTFITNAARNIHKAGGSLRDVQQLAGHRSLAMTQSYIEGDSEAKRRLVALI